MKFPRFFWIAAILASGCSVISGGADQSPLLLTPYVTPTPAAKQTATERAVEIPTPEPTLTPTPFVHTLGADETIYSLAYTYGLEVNEILAINPQITPKALSVGTEIMIPYIGDTGSGSDVAQSVISAPLDLELADTHCVPTAENGLWCITSVSNYLDQQAAGITVTFTLRNAAAETVSEQTVPALLNLLSPGETLPVVAYFAPGVPVEYSIGAALKTALPLDETGSGFNPLEIKVNSIDPAGRTARVSALIPAQAADSGIESVWVALVAYDESGAVVGVRRMEYEPVTAEEGQAVVIYVYSNSADIDKVDVLAETITEG